MDNFALVWLRHTGSLIEFEQIYNIKYIVPTVIQI